MQQQQDERRGSAHDRGYDSKWRKARDAYLREHPVCECDDCKRLDWPPASEVVDHIIPHRLKDAKDSGNPDAIARAQELFWNRRNWKAMSKRCHDRKTAREDGGFGR
ncbi:MAG TPA: HNH endonuclease [Noviherbaspirillum sp.]|nr:HNH endonuclease [Noviherbaspirillum sp.]